MRSLVVSVNTTGCVAEKIQHLKVGRRWSAYWSTLLHSWSWARWMCFCTAGFETYAAYALLVAKALWRDGMVYVLLRFHWLNQLQTGTVKMNYSPSIDHSHERGVSLVRVSPLSDWYVFQQRRVHGHFTRRTLIFRFKSMGEEKWTAGQGHKGRTCPLYLIYHTLFSHNEEQFH